MKKSQRDEAGVGVFPRPDEPTLRASVDCTVDRAVRASVDRALAAACLERHADARALIAEEHRRWRLAADVARACVTSELGDLRDSLRDLRDRPFLGRLRWLLVGK